MRFRILSQNSSTNFYSRVCSWYGTLFCFFGCQSYYWEITQSLCRKPYCFSVYSLWTLFIWTENFCQRKPPGTSKMFLTLLNITGFAQNFFLSIENPPVASSTIVPNPRSKKWSKWKTNTTLTLKTFKIMKLSCLVKKIFSLKKNRTLVFVFFHICNHNNTRTFFRSWLQI